MTLLMLHRRHRCRRKKMIGYPDNNYVVIVCVTAERGNTEMVEYFIQDCQANFEEDNLDDSPILMSQILWTPLHGQAVDKL